MRKIFSLIVIFLFATGCRNSKEDTFKDALVGSCWHQDIDNYQSYTFYFAQDKKCTVEWKTGIGDPVKSHHRYEYNYPNITISSSGGSGIYASGYIEGDIMYLENDRHSFELNKIR